MQVRLPSPSPRDCSHGPVVGPKRACSCSMSARASSSTVEMPIAASLSAVSVPIPHNASGGRAPITSHQVSAVSSEDTGASSGSEPSAALANPVASLARILLSPMPMQQVKRCGQRPDARRVVGQSDRVVDVGAQEALVPAPHLDQVAAAAHDTPDLRRRRVVGRAVRRQEDRVRAAAQGGRQRHARPDAEGAGLVGRGGDDLASTGRVTVATDDDRAGRAAPAGDGSRPPR